MTKFRDFSIQKKLTTIIMTTSCVALLLASAAFTWYEIISFRSTAAHNLLSLADIIGTNSTAAIPFNDQKSAGETLAALRAERPVVSAGIYTTDDEVFATYYRDQDRRIVIPLSAGPDGVRFDNSHLSIFRSIFLDGEKIGTVYIQYDLSEMYGRLRQYAMIVGVVMLVALLVALFLSSALQKVISVPVLALAQIAKSVSVDKDYSVRMESQSKDELGQLIDGFNEMLKQIQLRDSALQQAHNELEHRVDERTKSLASSLSLLNATLESTADGILVVDHERNIVNFNKKFLDMWRIPESIATLKSDNRLLTYVRDQFADADGFLQRVQEVYAQPDATSSDILHLRDGRVFERYSQPQHIAGESAGRVWSFRDITKQQLANELIRDQATLIEKAQDAILVYEVNGAIKFWNTSAERLYGWTAEEAIGKNPDELRLAEDRDTITRANESLLRNGEWLGELQQSTKDKKAIMVESRWSLVRDATGAPKSVLQINTDITGRKHLQAQFLRAQRMEGIGTLAAGIAHDINNILAPIMMSVDILKGKSQDPQSARLLGILGINSKRGADLVKQVLTFARGVEGERMTVQLKHIIKEIEKVARETFPRLIQIETNVANDLWPVLGDATQLHQVLLNFCVNARDAISGYGKILISSENIMLDETSMKVYLEAKVGPYVVLDVSDTGAGISKDILNKIFDPFFTTKERGKGTGLGLSTVIAIVKSHGGFVNVCSQPGKETSFKVFLPALDITETRSADEAPLKLSRGNNELILVVDDEVPILEMTGAMLLNFGYQVLTAQNGQQGLALYEQYGDQIALVITDMMMPVMDGPSLIKHLRQINPDVKVVAVSGLASDVTMGNGDQIGVNVMISKPFTSERLLNALSEAFAETAETVEVS